MRSHFLPEEGYGQEFPTWANLRILLAEDNAIEAMGIKSILNNLGHTVVSIARNGEEAVRFTSSTDPDLIIMDIKMPKLNGIEASSGILKKQSIPIIILTAYPEETYINEASELGIFGFRTKPVREIDLKTEIKITMDRFYERELLKERISELEEWRTTRKLVEKAKGILMEKHGISEEIAYKSIHKHSRNHCLNIAETATMILDGGEIPILVSQNE